MWGEMWGEMGGEMGGEMWIRWLVRCDGEVIWDINGRLDVRDKWDMSGDIMDYVRG